MTWEWGNGTGRHYNLLYGGVYGSSNRTPFFLALVDSLGVKQVLRFTDIRYEGRRRVTSGGPAYAPDRFSLLATHEEDSVRLNVRVVDAIGDEHDRRQFPACFPSDAGQFRAGGERCR